MCNGYRHDDGCSCGFGPPYLDPKAPFPPPGGTNGDGFMGVIRERTREKWASKSTHDKNKLSSGLSQLGIKPKWLKSISKKYAREGYPIRESQWNALSKNQQRGAARKMMRLLGLRQEIVAELETIDLDIPLFRLQPPGIENSEVSYEERQTKARGWRIFLEVPGFGLGADLSLRLEARGKIYACEKECKVIILPVRIKYYLVNLFMGKTRIARNKLIAEAGNKKTGQVYSRTVRSYRDFIPPASDALLVARYNLLDDLSGKNSQFSLSWGEELNRFAKITIPIPQIKPGIEIKITLEKKLLLEFDLAPGHVYELYPVPAGMGISWKVS
jgi:hypothetical protein